MFQSGRIHIQIKQMSPINLQSTFLFCQPGNPDRDLIIFQNMQKNDTGELS